MFVCTSTVSEPDGEPGKGPKRTDRVKKEARETAAASDQLHGPSEGKAWVCLISTTTVVMLH